MPETIYSIPGFQDPFSSLSHLLGAGVFTVLGIFLLRRGWGKLSRLFFLGVFTFATVFLLSMSGVYHLLSLDGTARMVMQRLDHSAIFFLIAGTLTPIYGILFRGPARWFPMLVVWGAAITGITLKSIYFSGVSELGGMSLYLGLGWVGAISAVVLWHRYGRRFIRPLFLGAVAYTIGALLDFLRWPVPVNGVIGSHELFHGLVLVALGFHWQFVFRFASGTVPVPQRALHPREKNHRDPPRGESLLGKAPVIHPRKRHPTV